MSLNAKTVQFSKAIKSYTYDQQIYPDSEDSRRSSIERTRLEQSMLDNIQVELKDLKSLFTKFRDNRVWIVFGNLGRQPHLLESCLDLYFSHEEQVIIKCDWNLPSHYQSKNVNEADFLFYIEPRFGVTIQKLDTVKHLIVFTSHLNLYNAYPHTRYVIFHLPMNAKQPLPIRDLKNCEKIKPPLFHDKVFDILPSRILLDVTKSKTAHEAYMRILTGREIVSTRPYKIDIKESDRITLQVMLNISEYKLKLKKGITPTIKKIYFLGFV